MYQFANIIGQYWLIAINIEIAIHISLYILPYV